MLFFLYELIKLVMSFFNFSGFQSPPRRPLIIPSPTSPFCTSPSQLQEVTLDQDVTFSNTMNLRSPSGTSRGRSVKEFEEQLTNLKKENFNLKLRIYFLEERMGTNFDLDKESVIKKNVELMVEIESLKKELQEKHELLCQAVKAMELEDEEHKKHAQEKEEQLMQCQQEIEDLRLQLQEVKFESDRSSSHRSFASDPSAYYTKQLFSLPESSHIIKELQDKINLLEDELAQEKENSASLQLLLDQTEGLKSRYEALQKETATKDGKISSLTDELQQAYNKITNYETDLKDLEQKLEEFTNVNEALGEKLAQKNKLLDDMLAQVNDLRKKYTNCKIDLEREHKRVERMRIMGDLKVTELEDESEKQKAKIRDLQEKLEAALMDVKKNQNLAVSKSPVHTLSASNTDVNSFSATDTAASTGVAQKDALHVPIKSPSANPLQSSAPSSPSAVDITYLQKLLDCGDNSISRKLVEQLKSLLNDYEIQKQKIVKLKAEQMKACKIIKGMIDSRNKYTEENSELKKRIDKLEKELENTVSKQSSTTLVKYEDSNSNLQAKMSELNIAAGSPSENERTMAESQGDGVELLEHYKALTDGLEEKIKVLMATMKEKDSHMTILKERYEQVMQKLQMREDRIIDLEFELLSLSQVKNSVKRTLFSEKSDIETEKDETFYLKQIEEKDCEIETLNAKINKLDAELRKRTGDLQGVVNKELWEKNRYIEKLENRHAAAIEAKEKEIKELSNDLSGKESQLQMLKDKISELGFGVSSELETDSQTKSSSSGNVEIRKLEEQLKSALEEKKYFEDKVKELQQKVDLPNTDDVKAQFIEKLQEDIASLQKEYEQSEKLRFETNEVCSVLSVRLEELAIFLDSLLKQKSVLGFLGSKQNKKLRQMIDQSLDLSRTFNISMLSNTEQSITQLSNLTSLLGHNETDISTEQSKDDVDTSLSIIPGGVTLTYQSHLVASSVEENCEGNTSNAQVIRVLREQIETLKYELQLRDTELNRLNEMIYQQKNDESDFKTAETPKTSKCEVQGTGDVTDEMKCETLNGGNLNTSATLKCRSENHSESEAWSEPDRSVSKARIGLESNSRPSSAGKRSRLTCKMSSESTEEECSRSLSKTPSKKSLAESRQTIIELHRQICELEEKMLEKDTKLIALEENNFEIKRLLDEKQENHEKMKSQLANYEIQVRDTEEKLAQAEKKKEEAENQIKILQKTVEQLQLEKERLEMHMEGERKNVHEQINLLETEKTEALKKQKQVEKNLDNARNELQRAENKVSELQKAMDEMKDALHEEYSEKLTNKLKAAEHQFADQLRMTEQLAEKEIKSLFDKMQQMEEEIKENYVKKAEVDDKILELEVLMNQNETLKTIVAENERNLKALHKKEQEHKEKFLEYQDKVTLLRRELDNATLQYSEAVLEKTKISNERSLLEQELDKVTQKGVEMRQQVSEIQIELSNVKESYQKQVAMLQDQKMKLEVRISELESANAELHNKLISLRSVTGDQIFSTSLPATTNPLYELGRRGIPINLLMNYRRQCSDNSEYNPEDQQGGEDKDGMYPFNQPIHPNMPPELERHEANSSPDLGIESDHGRFSSLEAQLNVPRPLLQTLELTESMNNLLDAENNQVQNVSCGNEHCCKRTLEMANENNDLKKKLMRTRRALEETVTQLTLANQRKKQVEKTICKQIHKTSQVLRKAKANLDSGSETDVYKK